MTSNPIKVVFADDHALVRKGLAYLLQKEPGIELIAQAANGKELLTLTRDLEPDVVITDIKMPFIDGLEATTHIVHTHSNIPVVALSMCDEPKIIHEIMLAGASGYVSKLAPCEEIILAIKTATGGNNFYCTHTRPKIEAYKKEQARHNAYGQPKPLNDKEKEILQCICEELTSKEITTKTGLTERTVNSYRKIIMEKTGSFNIAGMVKYAIKTGLYILSFLPAFVSIFSECLDISDAIDCIA
ncbi:MAG TPA: response regulator transcription factor [Ginsengibacter sp.]